MSQLLKDLNTNFSLDWQTLAVIAVLCALAAYFIREYLANPSMIIFVYPLLFLLSVRRLGGERGGEGEHGKKAPSSWTIFRSCRASRQGTHRRKVTVELGIRH